MIEFIRKSKKFQKNLSKYFVCLAKVKDQEDQPLSLSLSYFPITNKSTQNFYKALKALPISNIDNTLVEANLQLGNYIYPHQYNKMTKTLSYLMCKSTHSLPNLSPFLSI